MIKSKSFCDQLIEFVLNYRQMIALMMLKSLAQNYLLLRSMIMQTTESDGRQT